MGFHFRLRGIFRIQDSNLSLLQASGFLLCMLSLEHTRWVLLPRNLRLGRVPFAGTQALPSPCSLVHLGLHLHPHAYESVTITPRARSLRACHLGSGLPTVLPRDPPRAGAGRDQMPHPSLNAPSPLLIQGGGQARFSEALSPPLLPPPGPFRRTLSHHVLR